MIEIKLSFASVVEAAAFLGDRAFVEMPTARGVEAPAAPAVDITARARRGRPSKAELAAAIAAGPPADAPAVEAIPEPPEAPVDPTPNAYDYEKDLTPLATQLLKKLGPAGFRGVLEQLKVTGLKQLPAERYGEFMKVAKATLANFAAEAPAAPVEEALF